MPPLRGTIGPEAITAFLLQSLQIGAVRVSVLQHFFQRLAITNDGERVHDSLRARVVESARQVQHGFHVIGLRKHVDQVRLLDPKARF